MSKYNDDVVERTKHVGIMKDISWCLDFYLAHRKTVFMPRNKKEKRIRDIFLMLALLLKRGNHPSSCVEITIHGDYW